MHDRRTLTRLLLLLLLSAPAPAQPAGDEPAVSGDGLVAYSAAVIVTAVGDPVERGVLLVRGDTIADVLAAGVTPPAEAVVVDLGDVVLHPGLVNPLTTITPANYRGRRERRIASASPGDPADNRRAVGATGIDPRDPLYRRLGRTGYTSFALLPGDGRGLIAGQASVIRPRIGGEEKPEQLTVLEKAYLLLGYSTGKRWFDGASRHFKKAAEAIKKKGEAETKSDEKKPPEKDSKEAGGDGKEAAKKPPDPLEAAFRGEHRVFLRAPTAAAIEHLFRLLDGIPAPLRFVLVTGPQPPEVVDRLAARKDRILGVVLEPRMGTWWETSIYVNSARLFIERGVEVALVPASDDLDGHREVFLYLAEMVKAGMSAREVLAAVTTVPARWIGLENRVGKLAKGAAANFAVYDREPMAGNARLLAVYVEGERVFADDPASGRVSGEAVR